MISEADKIKILKTVRRNESVASGFDVSHKVFKNKKLYSRKNKHMKKELDKF